MKFTEKSALVTKWVKWVQSGKYQKEDVPELFNLRELVYKALEEH